MESTGRVDDPQKTDLDIYNIATQHHNKLYKHNTTMIDILAGIATITLFASSHFCADEQIEETAANNTSNSSNEEEGTVDVIAVSTSTSSNSGGQDECTTPNNTTSASHEIANKSTSTLPTNKLNNNITSNTTTPSAVPTDDNIIQHNGAEYVITAYQEEDDEEETQFTNNFRIPTMCSTEIIGDTVYGLVRYVTESCSNTSESCNTCSSYYPES